MRRLFRRWDTDMTDSLSLQNVVTGFAHVKGTKDIMSNISYFFELYDDDGDGKVDREGILRISEALLFLSRRGVLEASPSTSTTDIENNPERLTRDEQFLSSVSAFIRRCFEYADPDHPSNQDSQSAAQIQDGVDNFAIGDDDEDDLIDFGSEPSTPKASKAPVKSDNNPLSPAASTHTTASESAERDQKAESANLALDPNKPLHITLPTFRMVILADEVLEQFFEVGFSSSFRLADESLPFSSSSANLTTFANAGKQAAGINSGLGVVGGAGAGVVPPGKGLRGMLDNIVTDGMRVATEVRRRYEEAQKELDKEARHGRDDDEDDEEAHAKDSDLLEGAETAGVDTSKSDTPPELLSPDSGSGEIKPTRNRSASDASRRVLEFEAR
jgi:hypothetical protein